MRVHSNNIFRLKKTPTNLKEITHQRWIKKTIVKYETDISFKHIHEFLDTLILEWNGYAILEFNLPVTDDVGDLK